MKNDGSLQMVQWCCLLVMKDCCRSFLTRRLLTKRWLQSMKRWLVRIRTGLIFYSGILSIILIHWVLAEDRKKYKIAHLLVLSKKMERRKEME